MRSAVKGGPKSLGGISGAQRSDGAGRSPKPGEGLVYISNDARTWGGVKIKNGRSKTGLSLVYHF